MRSVFPQIHATSTVLQPPRSEGTQSPAQVGRPGMLEAIERLAKVAKQREMARKRMIASVRLGLFRCDTRDRQNLRK